MRSSVHPDEAKEQKSVQGQKCVIGMLERIMGESNQCGFQSGSKTRFSKLSKVGQEVNAHRRPNVG
eukprot:2182759-Amphidinium_carterae.1